MASQAYQQPSYQETYNFTPTGVESIQTVTYNFTASPRLNSFQLYLKAEKKVSHYYQLWTAKDPETLEKLKQHDDRCHREIIQDKETFLTRWYLKLIDRPVQWFDILLLILLFPLDVLCLFLKGLVLLFALPILIILIIPLSIISCLYDCCIRTT